MDDISAIEGLSALAQASRLAVFRLLVRAGPEGLMAGEIAREIGTPQNTMSAHLAILSRAGLITAERAGRAIVYRLNTNGVTRLFDYLVSDCCAGRPELCAPLLTTRVTARNAVARRRVREKA